MANEQIRLTRIQLYDLVWSKPTTAIAHDFGISDVALSKVCKKNDIPKPPLGYWSMLKHGKKVERPPLPSLSEEPSIVIRKSAYKNPDLAEAVLGQIAEEKSPDRVIVIKEKLTAPHALIRQFKDAMGEAYKDSYGRLSTRNAEVINIRCSPQSLGRALRIMDALIKALEARGFPVLVTDKVYAYDSRTVHTIAIVSGEKIAFHMEEPADRSEVKVEPKYSWSKSHEWVYTPSGKLNLVIDTYVGSGVQKLWADAPSKPIETRLNSFVAGLLVAAEAVRRRKEEDEARERIESERRRLREEEMSACPVNHGFAT